MHDQPIRFLDHGYVRYIDHMGSDESIVRAAKMSYDDTQGTIPWQDRKRLIYYLMEHRHTSPFEMAELQVEIQAPLFVVQQLLRHRTANINQLSMRYTSPPEEMYNPPAERFRPPHETNKQGTSDTPIEQLSQGLAAQAVATHNAQSQDTYKRIKATGASNEITRVVLPATQYTRLVWKCDLHNLLHFLKLRTDHHAQEEIRHLAIALEELVSHLWPVVATAWREFVKHSVTFSRTEMDLLYMFLKAVEEVHNINLSAFAKTLGFPKEIQGSRRRGRDFMNKLGLDLDEETKHGNTPS